MGRTLEKGYAAGMEKETIGGEGKKKVKKAKGTGREGKEKRKNISDRWKKERDPQHTD